MDAVSRLDLDADVDMLASEDAQVQAWRCEQLHRLGLPRPLANALSVYVDWHQLDDLVQRGCPWRLALEIVR